MFDPLEVKALSGYRIWIRYADGEEGEVDLSHLAGQGVFGLWEDEQKWKNVRIAEDGAIRWSDEVELCPDATYLKLTGTFPEEAVPELKSTGPCLSSVGSMACGSRGTTDDHNPPHFPEYGGDGAVISIDTLDVIAGELPSRALGLVCE